MKKEKHNIMKFTFRCNKIRVFVCYPHTVVSHWNIPLCQCFMFDARYNRFTGDTMKINKPNKYRCRVMA